MNIKIIAISVSEKLELREIFKNKIQPASLMHLYTRKKKSLFTNSLRFSQTLDKRAPLNLQLVPYLFLSWRSHQTGGASAKLLSSNVAL